MRRDYMMEAFVDELGDIIKQADVMQNVGNPVQTTQPQPPGGFLNSTLGNIAIPLALGVGADLWSKRDIGTDLTDLAGKIRHPTRFKEGLGEGAKFFFAGRGDPEAKTFIGRHSPRLPFILGSLTNLAEAKDLFKKDDPTGQGRSRIARATGLAGNIAGGILGSSMGATAGTITGLAGGAIGRGVGAGIDKLRGYRPYEDRG